MEERSKLIKSILPKIEIETSTSLTIEYFQSETLRPILKFQNEIILVTFESFCLDNKFDVQKLTSDLKLTKIVKILKTSNQLKQLYLGMIIGFFTSDEIIFYTKNKKDINKRIIALLIERIYSQV